MLLKGNLPQKMYSYSNILRRNYISYIFEFQLVPFALNLLLGKIFMASPSLLKYGGGEGGGGERGVTFFQENVFRGGTNFEENIYREIVLHERTNDGNIPRGKQFHKIHFSVI